MYNTKGSISRAGILGAVLLGSFLYGLSDEFHQSFVSGRNASILDSIADTIGGVVGGCMYLLFLKRAKNK